MYIYGSFRISLNAFWSSLVNNYFAIASAGCRLLDRGLPDIRALAREEVLQHLARLHDVLAELERPSTS
eukprot:15473352-Alexandrium_andersonii.AAC.1